MTLTLMEEEALSAPRIIAEQFSQNKNLFQTLAKKLRENPPPFAMTIARGSSDHAATFAKYILETQANIVTASASPSVCTLYEANLNLKNALVIAISQSGQSPDIIETLLYAKKSGAVTVALVNKTDSPLAEIAEFVIPLHAGLEISVAATKSYLATLSAILQFTAIFTDDSELLSVLPQLPERLEQATTMNWLAALEEFKNQNNAFMVARGYGFSCAQEAALKLKETAKVHAEAFSSAELLHGPMALIKKTLPIFLFAQHDATLGSVLEVGLKIKSLGGKVLLALPEKPKLKLIAEEVSTLLLPMPSSLHPMCDPLLIIQAFYLWVAKLSVLKGLDPDKPDNITKVTQTW